MEKIRRLGGVVLNENHWRNKSSGDGFTLAEWQDSQFQFLVGDVTYILPAGAST